MNCLSRLLFCCLLSGLPAFAAEPPPPPIEERSLRICVAAEAPPEVRQAATSLLAAAATHPLLRVFAGSHPPATLTESATLLAAPPAESAFHHLVLVGLASDPLIQAAWSHEMRMGEGSRCSVFGFGHLQGEIGLLEADRSPFLHSRFIARAPFETEIVTLTGTTPAGVVLAVEAFLHQGLVNGVVAHPGWQRPERNLLQRDPLPPGFTPPGVFPATAGPWVRIALTQAAEDEYRGVLEETGAEPVEIWRAKYYRPGVWDGPGAASAIAAYAAGLHRRAAGHTLWAARFPTEAAATAAAPKIALAARLQKDGPQWTGTQPPAGYEKKSPGPLTLAQRGSWLFLCSVPEPSLLSQVAL